jgi:long-subunit acyl-CoA synthetase (AMP-forming)
MVGGNEARLADDGELLLHRPAPGRAPGGRGHVVDASGWSPTGDRAEIDGDGSIRIVGRCDDVVDVGDRTVMASEVERRLCASPFVRHAVVCPIGDGRLGALVEADARAVQDWARRRGLAFTGHGAMVATEEVRALLAAQVDAVNAGLAGDGLPPVAAHRLLPQPLDADAGEELTAVRTVRRPAVLRQRKALVEEMASPVLSTGPGGGR